MKYYAQCSIYTIHRRPLSAYIILTPCKYLSYGFSPISEIALLCCRGLRVRQLNIPQKDADEYGALEE
jgi:hypothetical protein